MKSSNMGTLHNEFRSFETEYSLFSTRIQGIPIWERIRFNIYQALSEESRNNTRGTSVTPDNSDNISGSLLWLKNLFYRNPFLSTETNFLFVGHPRRKKEADGYWWDIYCDPIYQTCSIESLHTELPYSLNHRTPTKTDSVRYLELLEYGGTIQRKLGLHEINLTNDEKKRLKKIERAMQTRFETEISFVDRVIRDLWNRRCRLWLYKRFLDRVSPSVAVVVVSYGKETFIEACKSKDIPVVELQHGVIYRDHLGYSFTGNRTKEMFPDYLLTWGDFWQEGIEFPISGDQVISVGYPYLEQRRSNYKETKTTDQILFISQPNVGVELSKFAIEVNEHDRIDHKIVYKLHPNEWDSWKSEYPWLEDVDFKMIGGSGPSLYQLFAESNIQIGVGSTAIYEGLAFGLRTFVYDHKYNVPLEPVVSDGVGTLIDSVTDLYSSLNTGMAEFDEDYYFHRNASDRMCETLKKISEDSI